MLGLVPVLDDARYLFGINAPLQYAKPIKEIREILRMYESIPRRILRVTEGYFIVSDSPHRYSEDIKEAWLPAHETVILLYPYVDPGRYGVTYLEDDWILVERSQASLNHYMAYYDNGDLPAPSYESEWKNLHTGKLLRLSEDFVVGLTVDLARLLARKNGVSGVSMDNLKFGAIPLHRTSIPKKIVAAIAATIKKPEKQVSARDLMAFTWDDLFSKDGLVGPGARNGSNALTIWLARNGLTPDDLGSWEVSDSRTMPENVKIGSEVLTLLKQQKDKGTVKHFKALLQHWRHFPAKEMLLFIAALLEWLKNGGSFESFLQSSHSMLNMTTNEKDELISYLEDEEDDDLEENKEQTEHSPEEFFELRLFDYFPDQTKRICQLYEKAGVKIEPEQITGKIIKNWSIKQLTKMFGTNSAALQFIAWVKETFNYEISK